MIPRLYKPSLSPNNYNTNGYGFFNTCKSCKVTEEHNGEYTLEMSITTKDRLAEVVSVGAIIKALANHYDAPQLFYITQIVTSIQSNGERIIDITGTHIKYLHYQNCTLGYYVSDFVDTPKGIMSRVLSNDNLIFENVFTFYSNIDAEKTFENGLVNVKKLGNVYGGEEGSLLDVYGGEYHFDNFKIELLKQRGQATTHILRYGKDMSSYQQTVTNDNIYTHVLAHANIKRSDVDGTYDFAAEPIATGIKRVFANVLELDCTSECSNLTVNPSNGDGYQMADTTLRLAVHNYIQKSGFAIEGINIVIDYKEELAKLQDIRLCDTINVVVPLFDEKGMQFASKTIQSKITKTEFNSLTEQYTQIEIGEAKLSLANFITKTRR